MNISSISAITAAYGLYYPSAGAYYPPSGSGSGSARSKSVTTQANGATITTIRGATNDIVSVTTVQPAASTASTTDFPPQSTESTFDITA